MADVPALLLLAAALVAVVVGVLCFLLGRSTGRAGAAGREASLRTALELERARAVDVAAGTASAAAAVGERAEHELARTVAPLTERLTELRGHLAVLERQRAEAWAGMREQVGAGHEATERLRAETATLAGALRAGDVRGRWGEVQLARVVELAGMAEHVDVEVQPVLRTGDGEVRRPDMVVHLAGGRSLAVDAKVPLRAWLDAQGVPPDRARAFLAAHARALRAHVTELADRGYPDLLAGSPDLVVLFVPSDAVLDAALRADPALLEDAFRRGVVPATPSTLVALLRTAALGWRQEALADGAREVARLGAELLDRVGTLGGHVDRLGRSLSASVEAYNRTLGCLESRVLVSARRMADLGVAAEGPPAVEPVTVLPRPASAPELVRDRA